MAKEGFKKDDLIKLAHAKIKNMKVSELKEFIGLNKPLVVIPETYKIDISFSVQSYNNSNSGRNSSGGDLYKRATVRIKNQEINVKELEISVGWFVPSGYGDGNIKTEPVQYILTDKDILGIKEHGTRNYLRALFSIQYTLNHNTQLPYTLPKKV